MATIDKQSDAHQGMSEDAEKRIDISMMMREAFASATDEDATVEKDSALYEKSGAFIGGLSGIVAGSVAGIVIGTITGAVSNNAGIIVGAIKGAVTGLLAGASIGGVAGALIERKPKLKPLRQDDQGCIAVGEIATPSCVSL